MGIAAVAGSGDRLNHEVLANEEDSDSDSDSETETDPEGTEGEIYWLSPSY